MGFLKKLQSPTAKFAFIIEFTVLKGIIDSTLMQCLQINLHNGGVQN